jgi:regulatory protein
LLVDQDEEAARSIALQALDRAPRSRAQLADILAKKGVPDGVAAAVLERFEAVGLVDDQALAEMITRTRHAERGLVGQALAVELRRKGIDAATASAAMSQVTREDEAAAAERWARKKLAATSHLPTETRLRRTASLLARKGHSPGLALATVQRLLAEERSNPS